MRLLTALCQQDVDIMVGTKPRNPAHGGIRVIDERTGDGRRAPGGERRPQLSMMRRSDHKSDMRRFCLIPGVLMS